MHFGRREFDINLILGYTTLALGPSLMLWRNVCRRSYRKVCFIPSNISIYLVFLTTNTHGATLYFRDISLTQPQCMGMIWVLPTMQNVEWTIMCEILTKLCGPCTTYDMCVCVAGKLNYLGSSHQWWHLMVVLAFAWTHHMTTLVFLYWSSHPCPATLVPLEDSTSRLLTVALTDSA